MSMARAISSKLRLINNSLATWPELLEDTSKELILLIKTVLGDIERLGVS